MKSPLLTLPGAVPAEGVDEGVAAHYGDLFREQRALADGSGFVDLSHRGVVTVSGSDRLTWLHLLLTQHVTDLPPHRATEALILSANGHIEHALYLVDDGETVWAHVEPGSQEALIAYLESMKFFYRVEVADRTADTAVVHLPAGSIADVPEGVVVRETPYGRDVFLPRADLESYTGKTGPAAGILAYEALRVEQHRHALGHLGDGPGGQVHHRDVRGAVGDLDPVEELHRLQVRNQRLLGAGLDVRPGRLPVVDQVERVLDVAVRGEDQRLGGLADGEVADVLGEQQVQPGQPVLAGDGDDSAVREVDETGAVGEGTLLAEQVAVVPGDAFVHALGGDGAGQGQQRALHTPKPTTR